MDGQRFDAWTKGRAAGQSRRGFLARLAGVGVALGLAGAAGRATPAVAQEEDPKDAGRCAEKAWELAVECAALDDEKEAERCAEREGELCAECDPCTLPRFEVDSRLPGGVDTGLPVLAGQTVCVHAAGGVDHGGVLSDPDGSPIWCFGFQCGTLTGIVGGEEFALGSAGCHTAAASGTLVLRVFDCSDPVCYPDNEGSYTVDVAVI